MKSATDGVERIYILAAFALFLAGVEYMIPKPLPFMRLGLANLPILISLILLSPRQVLLLTLYKVIGQGLLQGTIFSYIFLFSAAGSFAGSIAMICIHRFLGRWTSLVGISIFGAFVGNIVRLILARYVLFGEQVWIVAPPFLILGLVSSLLLGVLAASFTANSPLVPLSSGDRNMKSLFHEASPGALFILGLFTLPAFLFQEKLIYRILDTVFFLVLALCTGKRIRPLPALLLLASVTAAALLVPFGNVLTTFFGLPITAGALKMGFSRGVLLLGLFYLSKFTVVRGLSLPGKIGNGIARVFFYFERFSENYGNISIRDLPGSLDNLLLKVSEKQDEENRSTTAESSYRLPLLLPLLISLVCWVFLFL